MQIQTYKFTGLSPLLMSNVESVNRDLPQLKLGTKPNEGDIEKIAEGMTYRNEDGSFYMPTQALRRSLMAGCAGLKFPGMRVGAAKIFQGVIFTAEDRATVLNGKGKPAKTYQIQVDSGVNKANKARIVVVRPRIEPWSMVVPFDIDEEFAPANFDEFLGLVLRAWNRAGRMVGIGAWRPQNQGSYGRYAVESV